MMLRRPPNTLWMVIENLPTNSWPTIKNIEGVARYNRRTVFLDFFKKGLRKLHLTRRRRLTTCWQVDFSKEGGAVLIGQIDGRSGSHAKTNCCRPIHLFYHTPGVNASRQRDLNFNSRSKDIAWIVLDSRVPMLEASPVLLSVVRFADCFVLLLSIPDKPSDKSLGYFHIVRFADSS